MTKNKHLEKSRHPTARGSTSSFTPSHEGGGTFFVFLSARARYRVKLSLSVAVYYFAFLMILGSNGGLVGVSDVCWQRRGNRTRLQSRVKLRWASRGLRHASRLPFFCFRRSLSPPSLCRACIFFFCLFIFLPATRSPTSALALLANLVLCVVSIPAMHLFFKIRHFEFRNFSFVQGIWIFEHAKGEWKIFLMRVY